MAIVTNAGRDAVDAAASGAQRDARRVDETCERSNGELTNDAAADGEVVWSRRPDAGVKFAEVKSALPGADKTLIRWTTVAKQPGHRGEHEGNR